MRAIIYWALGASAPVGTDRWAVRSAVREYPDGGPALPAIEAFFLKPCSQS